MLKTSKELLEYIIHATHKREEMKGPKLQEWLLRLEQ